MMKLNGKTYLTHAEVTCIIDDQLSRFSTSQHIIPPKDISYIDAEFVSTLKNKSKDIHVGLGFLYKNDEYVVVNGVTNMMATFLIGTANASADTTFLTKALTDVQKKTYRGKYSNYLLNILIGEIVKQVLLK